MQRKFILYIACSLDGYIAGPGDDLAFLEAVQKEGEDYGYAAFHGSIDTVIMGRPTYEKVLSFGIPYPHAEKTSYILSRESREGTDKLFFWNGIPAQLAERLQGQSGGNIFIDGGAETVHSFLKEKLIDEIIISYIPVLLGDGIPLFRPGVPKATLELLSSRSFDTGLLQVHYRVLKNA